MSTDSKANKAKFTPGPWSFSRFDQFGDSRFYVAQADGAPYTPHYSDVATLVAETVSLERLSIQEANARLIAAAPDQHEALQATQLLLERLGLESSDEYQRNAAAIDKALGGAA